MFYTEKKTYIEELQRKIDSHGILNPELKRKIEYKFRLDWNYYSNSMEGNTLTSNETRSIMTGNLTVGGKPVKDVLEVKGHDDVISEILRVGKGEIRLSEARIKSIHKGIMHEEDFQKKKLLGEWKKDYNEIINYKGEKFEFAPPDEIPTLIHDLLNRTNAAIDAIQNRAKKAPHPIDVALNFHLEYLKIHPFYDGNGRTARILTNLILISLGFPPFWIKTNEKTIFYQYIADIQGYGGNPDSLFAFCADMIIRSQKLILDAIEGKAEYGETIDDSKLEEIRKQVSSELLSYIKQHITHRS